MTAYIIESALFLSVALAGYHLVLKRSKYWQFNRFYLLLTMTASFAIPLVDIEVSVSGYKDTEHLIAYPVTTAEAYYRPIPSDVGNTVSPIGLWEWVLSLYLTGVALMALRFAWNLMRLLRTVNRSVTCFREGYRIVLMDNGVGPFSFLYWVFVNRDDFSRGNISDTVWSHEKTHIRKLHAVDILWTEILLIIFYFQPMLWLFRSAIRLNHEFEADQSVLKEYPDIQDYAYQLIGSNRARNNTLFECSFNFLSTKQRLIMLNGKKKSPLSFLIGAGAVITALTIAGVLLAFKQIDESGTGSTHEVQQVIMIDLGHGGQDEGAVGWDGATKEADLIASIGARIRELDKNNRFIFTRADENLSLQDRTKLAKDRNADLFVSLHISSSKDPNASGVEVFYSTENPAAATSREMSERIATKLVFRNGAHSNAVKTANFVVLKDAQCPAVMVTLGFISNKEDCRYLLDDKNQRALAKQLVGILSK
jgi:N-acetylmuramoyl-L-alanine amidase